MKGFQLSNLITYFLRGWSVYYHACYLHIHKKRNFQRKKNIRVKKPNYKKVNRTNIWIINQSNYNLVKNKLQKITKQNSKKKT